ncbi:glycosyltransferase [Cytophagaceae bacterium ABcell3]|nr:glycosyltransferase [Cytophagaceae bacterium ABcell3]
MSKKLLFATAPFDGHFNPLTGLAMHLKEQGFEVRWYTGSHYADKLRKLDISHYATKRAKELTQDTLDDVFPERAKLKSTVKKIKFDIKNVFIGRSPEYYEDVKEIKESYDFDLVVCDSGFAANYLIKNLLNIPVICVGVMPLMESSKDLAPYGLGIAPEEGAVAKIKQGLMRFMSKNMIFKEGTVEFNKILKKYGLEPVNDVIFDVAVRYPSLFLQSGVLGFEYKRSDMSHKVKFVGPLLPYKKPTAENTFEHEEKLSKYDKVILVSQGTVDNKEPEKLMIPALEALKDSNSLVIVATGGANTEEIRNKYGKDNIIVEDFVDFDYIMPKCDLYITNGGYGSTLMALSHGVPLVAAGLNEGKNEITARIGYFKLGVNLGTDTPTSAQLGKAVRDVLSNKVYAQNVEKLSKEFQEYDAYQVCEKYINDVISASQTKGRHEEVIVN